MTDSKTLKISGEALEGIMKIAKLRGIDHLPLEEQARDVLKHALGTELFLVEKVSAGARVTIETRRWRWWPGRKMVRDVLLR